MKTVSNKIKLRLTAVVALIGSTVFHSLAAHAQFNYPDFSSTNKLNILNSAGRSGAVLRLNPAVTGANGTVYYAMEQSLSGGFDTRFSFQITERGGATDASGKVGGDGLAFIIQHQGPTFTGPHVAYIPYSIPDCLAVEYDTYQNANIGDPNGNHISLQPVGSSPNGTAEFSQSNSLGFTTEIPNMADGNVHQARILYTPGLVRLFLDNLTTPVVSASINLTNINGRNVLDSNGSAWIGFAAGTGASYENHDILSWSFVPSAPLITQSARKGDGSLVMSIVSQANSTNVVQCATNLSPPIFWQPIATNFAAADGTWQFTDTNATRYQARFYRLQMQ